MVDMETTAPTAPTMIDQATQDRLARLAARRPAGSPTSAFPAPNGRPVAPTARTNAPATAPTGRTKKRHAAKGSRTAAVVMSIATSFGLSAYFHFANSTAASASARTSTAATTGGTSTAAGATAAAGTSTAASGSTAAASSTAMADGTYLGATDTNRWGPVQVQITVSGGKIAAVTAVQTPSENGRDVAINSQATPILASEALTAQSANIDTVSGATYTSHSYKTSLQSALTMAGF